MPALQIKDCPAGVYDSLKRCASAEDRSMSQQALHILKRFLDLYDELESDSCPDARIFNCESESERSDTHFDALTLKHSKDATKRRSALLRTISELDPIALPEDLDDTAALIRKDRADRLAIIDPDLATSRSKR